MHGRGEYEEKPFNERLACGSAHANILWEKRKRWVSSAPTVHVICNSGTF